MLNLDLSQQPENPNYRNMQILKFVFFYPILSPSNPTLTFGKKREISCFSQNLPPDMKANQWFLQKCFCVPMANCRSVFMFFIHEFVKKAEYPIKGRFQRDAFSQFF